MYSANDIALWFIKKAKAEGRDIYQMKLYKLLYIAQGVFLVGDKVLFKDDIEAWQYGPVIPAAYRKFKIAGPTPINWLEGIDEEIKTIQIDHDTEEMLTAIWENFKDYSSWQLSNWSHEKDSPWYKEWEENGGKNRGNHVISHTLIADYFKKYVSQI